MTRSRAARGPSWPPAPASGLKLRVDGERGVEVLARRRLVAQRLLDHAQVEGEQRVLHAGRQGLVRPGQRLRVLAVDVQRPGVGVVHLEERPDLDAGLGELQRLGRVAVVGVVERRVGVEQHAVGLEQLVLDVEGGVLLLRLGGLAQRLEVVAELDDVLRLRDARDDRGVVGDRRRLLTERRLGLGLALVESGVGRVDLQAGLRSRSAPWSGRRRCGPAPRGSSRRRRCQPATRPHRGPASSARRPRAGCPPARRRTKHATAPASAAAG